MTDFLHKDWQPAFGSIFSWFAMDKYGKIAMFINYGFGNIPKKLLIQSNVDEMVSSLTDYIWEEHENYHIYPNNKCGETILDLYSSYPKLKNRLEKEIWINSFNQQNSNLVDENLPSRKGIFIYQAVEGDQEGDDYPVGYEGETKMGDYYRYLMPTIYATIDDFPRELWNGIALSKTVDFTKDRIVFNNNINQYFTNVVSDLF